MQVDEELIGVLEELRPREPIFHTEAFGDFDTTMVADYWEIGASGRRYSRDFILEHLSAHPPVDAGAAGWETRDFGLRRLGSDTYLLTYTLQQAERTTRRATIWEKAGDTWRILYHQGTIVSE
jgi:hypothetical protein